MEGERVRKERMVGVGRGGGDERKMEDNRRGEEEGRESRLRGGNMSGEEGREGGWERGMMVAERKEAGRRGVMVGPLPATSLRTAEATLVTTV